MKRKILLVISIVLIAVFASACGGNRKAMMQTSTGTFRSGSSFASSFFEGSSSSGLDFSRSGTSFSVTNATGYPINSMIMHNSLNEEQIILVQKETPFLDWTERNFFCPMVDPEGVLNLPEDFDGSVEYDAEIKLENGAKFLLHDFPLGKSVKILIIYEKNTGYLLYENLKNDQMISTMDREILLSKQNVVNSGETYGEIQDPYNEYYRNPYADYDQPPVYVEPDIEAIQSQGGKDGCLDGGLFW